MKTLSRITLGSLGIGIAAMTYWRFAVRRHTLPCPSWLIWLLENPFMNAVAGANAILNRMELQPGMKVLDVGCGPGRLTVPAAQRVGASGEVVAVDIQPAMLGRLRQKLHATGLTNVRLIQAGVGGGTLANGIFDRALLVTVLGEIPDRKAALTEIFHALKPGGILSITEVLPDPHYQTSNTIRRLAAEVGFQEQACFGGFPAFTIHLRKPDANSLPRIKVEGLSHVSETLFIALYLRALESRRPGGLINGGEVINQAARNKALTPTPRGR